MAKLKKSIGKELESYIVNNLARWVYLRIYGISEIEPTCFDEIYLSEEMSNWNIQAIKADVEKRLLQMKVSSEMDVLQQPKLSDFNNEWNKLALELKKHSTSPPVEN